MNTILAIIVSYNFEPWLDKCLESLRQSSIPLDILVIDNCSSDNTVNRIKTDYPDIEIICNNSNLGFGGANNIGLQICIDKGYDYAFLINQDAWIAADCVEQLLKVKDNNKNIISPLHLDGTGEKLDKGFEQYIQKSIKTDEKNNRVDFINAAFWLIPSSILKTIGYFSPIFHHYGEDVDYGNRVKYFDLGFIYVAEAKAYHDRQNRQPSSPAQFIKSEYVYFLTVYCNINYSISKAAMYSIAASLKKSFYACKGRDTVLAKEYINVAYRLITKTSAVLQTRRYNRKTTKFS